MVRHAAIVLLIHAGGWVSGTPADEAPIAASLQRAGLETQAVAYPLNDPSAAFAAVDAAAREARRTHARVLAYGQSAGATMAAWLAARGKVDAAVVWEGPTDLLTWQGAAAWPRAARARLSPARRVRRSCAPQLLVYGTRDQFVPLGQMRGYRARLRAAGCAVRSVVMPGRHHWYYADYDAVAQRWLEVAGNTP